MSKILDAREEFYYRQSSRPPNSQPPTFEQLPGTGQIVEGSDAHFECRIRGNPMPQVTWSRRGVPVRPDARRVITYDTSTGICTLTIKNLTIDDDGEYKCTAKNVAGEASLTINIQRNAPGQNQGLALQGQPIQQQQFQQVIQQQSIQRQHVQQIQQMSTYQTAQGINSASNLLEQNQRQEFIQRHETKESFSSSKNSSSSVISPQASFDSILQQQQQQPQQQPIVRQESVQSQVYSSSHQKYTQEQQQQPQPILQQSHPQPPVRQESLQRQRSLERQRAEEEERRRQLAMAQEAKRKQEELRMQEIIRMQEQQMQRAQQLQRMKEEAERQQREQQQQQLQLLRQQQQQWIEEQNAKALREQQQQLQRQQVLQQQQLLQQQKVQIEQKQIYQSQQVQHQQHMQQQQFIDSQPQQPIVYSESTIRQSKTETRQIKRSERTEEEEKQEQIFLRHVKPGTGQVPVDTQESETVYLRHVVPNYQAPQVELPAEKREPPRFTNVSKDVTILEGQVARIDARVEPASDAKIIIEWFKDGRSLTVGSRFQTFSGCGYIFLNIMHCVIEDTGVYTCRASNAWGVDEVTVNVSVIEKSELALNELDEEAKVAFERYQSTDDSNRLQRQVTVDETVKQRPRFLTTFKSLRINENETAHFECKIEPTDDPTLKVQWYHNGRELFVGSRWQHFHDFGFVSLNIFHCLEEDTGTYVCRITNEVGYAESSVTLEVIGSSHLKMETMNPQSLRQIEYLEENRGIYAKADYDDFQGGVPRFLSKFKDQRINERSAAHFEARIEPVDDPDLTISWFFNGQELQVGSRWQHFQDFGFVCLNILQCVTQDTGEYTCRLQNALGFAEQSVRLEVVSTKEIQNLDSLEKFQYLEDASRYKREVEFEEEERMPPRFLTPFKSIEIKENEIAHFECRIEPTSDPELKVEWFFNGKDLTIGSRFQPFHDFGFISLNILQCVEEDTGTYLCRISNSLGSAEQSVQLRVHAKSSLILDPQHPDSLGQIHYLEEGKRNPRAQVPTPVPGAPRFLTPFKDLTVLERQAGHFEARIEPIEDPTLKIEWFYNGKELQIGSRWQYLHDFGYVCLNILQTIVEDTGEYTCRVSNASGSAEASVKLTVLSTNEMSDENLERFKHLESGRFKREMEEEEEVRQAPVFLTPFKDVTIYESETAHFECRIEPVTDPKLKVEWLFNGKELRAGSRFHQFSDFGFISLNILQCVEEDTGTYTCRISNELGSAEQSVKLTCIPHGSLILDPLHPNSLQYIQQLEEGRKYERSQVPDSEGGPPRFLTVPQDVNIREGQIAHFECRIEPVTDPKLVVEWYKDDRQLTIGSRFQYVHDFGYVCLNILQTIDEDSGKYICRLRNDFGTAECSVTLNVTGTQGLILDPLHPSSLEQIQSLEKQERCELMSPPPSSQAPRFVVPLSDTKVPERHVAHFEARIEPVDDSSLKIEWFHNGKELPIGHRWQVFQDFGFLSLNILQTIQEDSGQYTCRLTNQAGSTECSVTLTVIAESSFDYESRYTESMKTISMIEDSSNLSRQEESETTTSMAPTFVTTFQEQIISENCMAHFECRIQPVSDPTLKVEWFHDGKLLAVGSRYQTFHDFGYVFLNILQCVSEDSGSYTCRITNSVGSAEQSVKLTVSEQQTILTDSSHPEGLNRILQLEDYSRYIAEQLAMEEAGQVKPKRMAPMFVMAPEPLIVEEGEVAKFQCRVIGYPRPRIMWVLNGSTCVNGTRFKLNYDGIHHLEVSKSRLTDSGRLEVFVRNIVGEANCFTTLEVRPKHNDYRAVLKNSPRPWYDIEHVRYQKERYESELDKIFEEKLTPGGTEVKVYRTEQGSQGHVKVQETLKDEEMKGGMPDNRKYKTDIFYVNKASTAQNKSADESNVSWMAKNYQSHIGSESKVEGKDISTLVQKQVQKENTGDLEITRHITQKDTLEQKHKGVVKEIAVSGSSNVPADAEPPIFTAKIQPQAVQANGDALFKCTFSGKPTPQVTWSRESTVITPSDKYEIATQGNSSILKVKQVSPSDAVVYSAKAENAAGVAKCSANLVVDLPKPGKGAAPSFIKTIQPVSALVGQLVRLDVRISGSPPLEVHWIRDGEEVIPDITHKLVQEGDLHTLLILEASPLDKGVYDCIVFNKSGEVRCTAAVDIRQGDKSSSESSKQVPLASGLQASTAAASSSSQTSSSTPVSPPQVVEPLKDITVQEGKMAVFKAKVTNASKSEVTWYKDSSLIKPSRYFRVKCENDVCTLTIAESFPEDEGQYTCQVSNAAGIASTVAALKIAHSTAESGSGSAPALSPLNSLSVTEGAPARFVTSLKGSPLPIIKWFRETMEIKPSRDFQMFQDNASCSLVIKQTYVEDSGVFTCRASNQFGEAETSATLVVKPK